MNVEITGRNYEITDRIRDLINRKFEKISKYYEDVVSVRCVLDVEKYRNICEVFIVGKSYDTKAVQEGETMDDAVNSAFDHLKVQAQKSRKKIRDRKRHATKGSATEWTESVLEPALLRNDDSRPRVIDSRNIPIRPMSIEQAAMTLDDSKNQFIVFRDLDTDKVTVIYRRRDNNFGMIAPEF